MADERDGVFDVGTFDNARFDSVYATSNAGLFSASRVKALLKPQSFLSAYSSNSKVLSLRRSVSSYANVFSSSDRVIAFDRSASSNVGTVFSEISSVVKRFGVSVSSYAAAYSNNSRAFALDRAATSFANVYSSNSRVANYVRQVSSFASAYSNNSRVVTYARSASSHVSMFSANKLTVKLKPSSFVGTVQSAMRALTNAPPVNGSLKTYLDSTRIRLSLDSTRIFWRDSDEA